MKFLKSWLLFFVGAIALRTRKTPASTDVIKDAAILYVADFNGAGTAAIHAQSEDNKVVKLAQGAALTADVADGDTVSAPTPGAEDYAFTAATSTSPFGFANANEADSFIALVVNLRTRINELEARLEANGLIA